MDWKKAFKEGKELILSTCSNDSYPNANVVVSLGFVEDKLLFANSQMVTTIQNLKTNKKICVVVKSGSNYFKLKGIVSIFNSGKYFDLCKKADKQFPVKHAILVDVKEVYDLDKVERIL